MAKAQEKSTDERISQLEALLEDIDYLCGETRPNDTASILKHLTQTVQALRCLTRIIKLEREAQKAMGVAHAG